MQIAKIKSMREMADSENQKEKPKPEKKFYSKK